MRISLFWKLFASHLGVVLLTTFCVGMFASARAGDEARETTERWLQTQLAPLEAIASPTLHGEQSPASLQTIVARLRGRDGTRYTVIAADGRVLADSEKAPAAMENHGSRPEVLEARHSGDGDAIRFSESVRRTFVYAARRVGGAEFPTGFVRVSVPMRSLDEDRASLRKAIIFSALIAVAIGFVLCLLLANRFAGPLRELTRAAEAIAAGDYDRRVPLNQRDEIGELAKAFGTMGENLRDRITTITKERSELSAVLKAMAEGVVAINANSELVLMNAAAGAILGVAPDQVRGKTLWSAVPIRPVAEVLEACLAEGEITEAEVVLPGPPAETVLELHAAPIRPGGSERVGVVLVMHDLTEVRRLERVRRDFVANASHELRTPVAAIRGFVETILDDDEMDPETERSFLGRAHRQTNRLTQIIEEMLELSRLEERAGRIEPARLDLREAVGQAVDTVMTLAGERDVTVQPELADEPVIVSASEEQLRRIVGNLLENAVKFTDPGSQVDIRVMRADTYAILEVRDRGPGIPVDDRERVFERFYRVDRGRSRAVGGTGLGLAIVKHLVQGLGGEVRVHQREDRGCTFRVRLPHA